MMYLCFFRVIDRYRILHWKLRAKVLDTSSLPNLERYDLILFEFHFKLFYLNFGLIQKRWRSIQKCFVEVRRSMNSYLKCLRPSKCHATVYFQLLCLTRTIYLFTYQTYFKTLTLYSWKLFHFLQPIPSHCRPRDLPQILRSIRFLDNVLLKKQWSIKNLSSLYYFIDEELIPPRGGSMGSACTECELDSIKRISSHKWTEIVPVTALRPGYEDTRLNFQKVCPLEVRRLI